MNMSLRTRLLMIVALAVVATAAVGAWTLNIVVRRTFEGLDEQRRLALDEQFRRELSRNSEEVARRVESIASLDAMARMALDLRQPERSSRYVYAARELAEAHSLDFLEIVSEGNIVSSAQWPVRFGYPHPWWGRDRPEESGRPFLDRQELPDGQALGVFSVALVRTGDRVLHVVGGRRLDAHFLEGLVLPRGMRVFLYPNLRPEFSAHLLAGSPDAADYGEILAPLLRAAIRNRTPSAQVVDWSTNSGDSDTVQATPLLGSNGDVQAVLLVASSRREIAEVTRFIRWMGVVTASGGILLGLGLGWWATARVTRPIQQLVRGARRVAKGHWETRVALDSEDEIGDLARGFNRMTEQLVEQRDRLVQAERVAAWRELARRMAHEMKNPLFPLQITVENLQSARQCAPDQFEEVFEESTETLLTEIGKLKQIVGRFSEFARMPKPDFTALDVNGLIREVLRLFAPQLESLKPKITMQLELDGSLSPARGDPDLLRQVLQNLILNALDAMPEGGRLILRSLKPVSGGVQFEVADTGKGLGKEEQARIFTPYYTTKKHGTGLGLAIVQSIVSDHAGKVSVYTAPGQGTTFSIWIPVHEGGGGK
jgi:two-component system, NtrC family, nitrogen regulation sensor histidine kinase NtrY